MKLLGLLGLCATLLLVGCSEGLVELRSNGISEFQLGHINQAKKVFQNVLERYPSDPDTLYYMGRVMHAEKFYEQAIYYYQCCLDADPSHKQAERWLVKAEEAAGPASRKLRFIP